MKPIDEIRRDNMARLAAEFGGVAGLARKLDRSESQVSQWANGSLLPSGEKRGMKIRTARWIDTTTGKPEGWLDTDHSTDYLTASDRGFVQRVEQELARYVVAPNIQAAIIGMITSQPERPTGGGHDGPPNARSKGRVIFMTAWRQRSMLSALNHGN